MFSLLPCNFNRNGYLSTCILAYLTKKFSTAIIGTEPGGIMSAQTHAHRIKISIDVSEEERIYIKMIAAKKKMTISEFIMSYVRPNIPHSEPNLETKKAMRDIEENKNLTRYKTVDDFWDDMGINPNA